MTENEWLIICDHKLADKKGVITYSEYLHRLTDPKVRHGNRHGSTLQSVATTTRKTKLHQKREEEEIPSMVPQRQRTAT